MAARSHARHLQASLQAWHLVHACAGLASDDEGQHQGASKSPRQGADEPQRPALEQSPADVIQVSQRKYSAALYRSRGLHLLSCMISGNLQ